MFILIVNLKAFKRDITGIILFCIIVEVDGRDLASSIAEIIRISKTILSIMAADRLVLLLCLSGQYIHALSCG